MNVKYCGPALDYSGYGEAVRHDIAALVQAGVAVTTQIPRYTMEISDYGKLGQIASKLENAPIDYGVKIIHTTPNVYRSFMEPGKYHIGRVFWETDKLPADFAQNCELMDELWTGSKANADAIRAAGVTRPIKIIPEAIDPDIPDDIPVYKVPKVKDGTEYTFYSIFEWTERKNPMALLEAYWREFESQENVGLVIKTYVDNFTPDRRSEIDNNIKMLKKQMGLSHYAPVYLYRGLMDRYQVYRFHQTFDCFVSAHRGEGWGIPQMEALALGKPVISTDLGGIHEYLIDGIHARLVPYELVQLSQNSRNQQWYTSDQKWAQIDIRELMNTMRDVFDHRAQAEAMGNRAIKLVRELFSLETIGDLMVRQLGKLEGTVVQSPTPSPVNHPSITQDLGDNVPPGTILKAEEVIEEKDEKGKVHSQWTIPATVKKQKIKVDYYARPRPEEE
jgi:glycosyltransferase involved in cell wall biosynthesis